MTNVDMNNQCPKYIFYVLAPDISTKEVEAEDMECLGILLGNLHHHLKANLERLIVTIMNT